MKFLFPAFLWALFFLIIPILIHLFNFRRPKKAFFSNVALLESIKTQTSSIQNLKHILILISRILFLGFLILAFAQPYIPSQDGITGNDSERKVKVFYLDNSFSMLQEKDGARLLDNAIAGLEAFEDNINANEQVFYLDNNFNVKDLYSYSKSAFLDRLAEVEPSFTSRNLIDVLNRIDQIEFKGNKEIFIISDLQKSTLGDISNIELDSNNLYHLIPLNNDELVNISIDSVWLDKPFVFQNEDNELNVRLFYQGSNNIENYPVKLFIDEKQASLSNVSLQNGQFSDLVFSLPNIGSKESTGSININDSPIYFDNEYYFTLKPLQKIIIHSISENESPYMKAVFKTANFFEYNYMNEGNLNLSELESSDFLIIDKVKNIPDYLNSFLIDFVKNGGHLLIIPNEDLSSIKSFLNNMDIGIYVINPPSSNSLSLKKPDLSNPFFDGVFEEIEENTDMPYAVPLFNIRGMELNHLLFADGNPFLSQKSVAKGRVYLVNASLTNDNSNVFRHSLFVPIMYKISTGSISGSNTALAFDFNSKSIPFTLNSKNIGESALVIKGNEVEIIPEQRPNKNGIVFSLPNEGLVPGFYDLIYEDSAQGKLALNIDRRESNMEFFNVEEFLDKVKKPELYRIEMTDNISAFASRYHESNFGIELWKYFLIVSLAFLCIEIFLLRVF